MDPVLMEPRLGMHDGGMKRLMSTRAHKSRRTDTTGLQPSPTLQYVSDSFPVLWRWDDNGTTTHAATVSEIDDKPRRSFCGA